MKSKKEIEQLAFLKYPRVINDNPLCRNPNNPMEDDNTYERKIWIGAYTQCQEDVDKNYTEREVVIMLQDCAIHFGIINKSKDDGTFTTQIDKWVKNKLNKQD